MFLIILILVVFQYKVFIWFLEYVNKRDNENIYISNIEKKVVVGTLLVLTTSLYLKYKLSFYGIVYYILTNLLITIAYIDLKRKVIYEFMNISIFILSIIFAMYQLTNGLEIKPYIEGFLFSTFISVIINTFNGWGKGDRNLFIAISLFMSSITNPYIEINYSVINMIFAGAIAGINNIVLNLVRKGKVSLNNKEAFAPYIMVTTLVSIIVQ